MGTATGRRGTALVRSLEPAGVALLVLIVFGVVLRLATELSWWPTATTLADSGIYAKFAESNPFADPQHPAGYALILASIGALTREVAVPIVLQHLSGIASALLLYGATRRITGSSWAGLLPAAIVLLNPDGILLEHAVMAESWAILATSAGMYAAVRALDEPRPLWRWPSPAGVLLAVSVTIRTAGLAAIAVVLLALVLARPRAELALAQPGALGDAARRGGRRGGDAGRVRARQRRVRPAVRDRAARRAGTSTRAPRSSRTAAVHPAARAPRRSASTPRPTSGTAPATTSSTRRHPRRGCSAPSRTRRTAPRTSCSAPGPSAPCSPSPATTAVGLGEPARLLGAEPDAGRAGEGEGLDPLLDYRLGVDDGFFAQVQLNVADQMQAFFDAFCLDPPGRPSRRSAAWQQVSRFGGTMLSLATVLVIVGLIAGTRRERVGELMLGVGGLALIAAPALTGNYTGRYTVPMAGPMLAGAAIALVAPAARGPSPAPAFAAPA